MDFHRCVLCTCTDPAAGLSPEIEQNLTGVLGTLPSKKKTLYSLVFQRGKKAGGGIFQTFTKSASVTIVCGYPQNQRDVVMRKREQKCECGKGMSRIRPGLTKHKLSSTFCKIFLL